MTIGFDFVLLLDGKEEIIVPYREVAKIEPSGRFAEPEHVPSLIDIDGCLRRDITFSFGAIVVPHPELLHRFFKIRLNIFLLLVECKHVKIILVG